MRELRFYGVEGPYGCFSNFSPHGFELDGRTWPTVEHWFQAMKFAGTPYCEEIRRARSPMIAKRLGQTRKVKLRADWERVKEDVMRRGLEAKFAAHEDARETLLSTGNARLIEAAPHDSYWGEGADRTGKNRLGTLLMELRRRLTEP